MECPLEVLILGLIATPLLWEGAIPAKVPGYSLHAPANVSVEEGLCVTIPCNFTYNPSDAKKDATLYGFWYDKGSTTYSNFPVATNSHKRLASFAQNRFHLIGNLEEGDCSLLIFNAQKTDRRTYFFRMEKETRANYNFYDYAETFLNVTERQAPEIQIQGTLRVGYPANITCAAVRSCSWQTPNITWKGFSKNINFHLWLNRTHVYSSVLSFFPSVADHSRNVICRVSYTNGSHSVSKKTHVQLDVNFPPQTPGISGEHLRSDKSLRNVTEASQLKVEKGDSILLYCKVKGNPLPTVTWVKGSQLLRTPLQSYNVLNLSDIKLEDVGEYKCQATNIEGSAEASLELFMAQDINNCLLNIVTGVPIMLAVVVLIIGVILASKRYWRKRRTVKDPEKETKHSALAPGNSSPIFENPNALDLALRKMNRIPPKPESIEESADRNPRGSEEIHYASLTFSAPNPMPDATSEEIQTDYAEIRLCSSQEKQGMKI
ncbi:sialic acid-binding Ig-like lectin 13 [Candoia aspera]|uniref:sialic acid-binding Ig-like lectin 13 n=1 Tax=Candoia aspera TaxID=51853 RepID=UPI002FD8650C